MRYSLRLTLAALVLAAAALVLAAAAPTAGAQHKDANAIRAVVREFHAALARGDSLTALAYLTPDVQILESGGRETLDEYRGHHLPSDVAFAQAVPATRGEWTVTGQGDVAWVVGTSRTTGTFRERQVDSVGAELIVLSRTPGGWRIRAIHWSTRAARTP